MKKKILVSCQQQYCFFCSGIMEIGWRFFQHGSLLQKEERPKRERKKWFEHESLYQGKSSQGNGLMQEYIMRVRPGALNRRCRTVISKALTD